MSTRGVASQTILNPERANQTGQRPPACSALQDSSQTQPVLPAKTTEPVFSKGGFIWPPVVCQNESPHYQHYSNNLSQIKSGRQRCISARVMHSSTVCVLLWCVRMMYVTSAQRLHTCISCGCRCATVVVSWASVSAGLILIVFSKCWVPAVFAQMRQAVRAVIHIWQRWESQWWMTRKEERVRQRSPCLASVCAYTARLYCICSWLPSK